MALKELLMDVELDIENPPTMPASPTPTSKEIIPTCSILLRDKRERRSLLRCL